MLEASSSPFVSQGTDSHSSHKVLRMVKNDRMAGFVPSWGRVSTSKQQIEDKLAQTTAKPSFSSVLAYQEQSERVNDVSHVIGEDDESFGFGDLLDMVNPLQHIPIVSSIYRDVTGDEIKPIGKIIGGAVFGGPAGAASGLVNVIVEEETGKDITGNALALVFEDDDGDSPETRLAHVETRETYDDLPASLLAFADTRGNVETEITQEVLSPLVGGSSPENAKGRAQYVLAAHGRTAGYISRFA